MKCNYLQKHSYYLEDSFGEVWNHFPSLPNDKLQARYLTLYNTMTVQLWKRLMRNCDVPCLPGGVKLFGMLKSCRLHKPQM